MDRKIIKSDSLGWIKFGVIGILLVFITIIYNIISPEEVPIDYEDRYGPKLITKVFIEKIINDSIYIKYQVTNTGFITAKNIYFSVLDLTYVYHEVKAITNNDLPKDHTISFYYNYLLDPLIIRENLLTIKLVIYYLQSA